MHFKFFVLISILFIFTGCLSKKAEPREVLSSDIEINYFQDVQPILDKRCPASHYSCISSCQLKMSSPHLKERECEIIKVWLQQVAKEARKEEENRLKKASLDEKEGSVSSLVLNFLLYLGLYYFDQ